MSQDISQELREMIDNGQLSEGEILTLTKKVLESGSEEAKFVLKLDEFTNYCYPDTVYRRHFSILYGDAKVIEAYHHEDTCVKESEYVIIPQTKIVVILEEWKVEGFYTVYVFSSSKGWLKLTT